MNCRCLTRNGNYIEYNFFIQIFSRNQNRRIYIYKNKFIINRPMNSPAPSEEHPVSRIYLPAYFIIASSVIPIIITIYCLSRGIFDLYPHLFYIPIILTAYAYPRKGVYGSVVLGGIYLGLVYLFAYPNIDALSGATTRFFFLVAIGTVITLLVRRMRDEEEKYHGIFDHSQDGVFLLSKDLGTILDANQRASELLSCSPDRLPGMDFPGIWQDSGTMKTLRKKIGDGESVAGLEGRIGCGNGKAKDVLISAGSLPDGKVACSVADITDRIESAKAVERERQDSWISSSSCRMPPSLSTGRRRSSLGTGPSRR